MIFQPVYQEKIRANQESASDWETSDGKSCQSKIFFPSK